MILKSKWYLARIDPATGRRTIEKEHGAFATDSKAFAFMFTWPDPDKPAVRKDNFKGYTTVKGERVLKYPMLYTITE